MDMYFFLAIHRPPQVTARRVDYIVSQHIYHLKLPHHNSPTRLSRFDEPKDCILFKPNHGSILM